MSREPNGFTWLEVLGASVLLMIVLAMVDRLERVRVHQSQNGLLEAIAMTRLVSLSHLLSLNPINREPWIDQWNRENRLCLPQGFGEAASDRTIRVFWRSPLGYAWTCHAKRLPGYRCVETRP